MSASLALAPGDPILTPRVHEVIATTDELPGVVTLRTVPVDGAPPRSFLPAQVHMLGAFGIGEAAISMSSDIRETEFREFTIRRVGPITQALTRLAPGEQLWVRGPFGRPWDLDLDGCDVVVAAGGIGIAPLRAAILELCHRRDRYGEVLLVVGARDPALLLYRSQYDAWRAAGLTVIETVDHRAKGWTGSVGYVSDVVGEAVGGLDPGRVRALTCGPDIMMRLTAERLTAAGVAPEHIQLTVERNMQCGNALCGHCQMGGIIVCRDGPVVRYPDVAEALRVPEL